LSADEMSSHDLSAEEMEKDQKLGVFVEDDDQTRLASQRDRQRELERF